MELTTAEDKALVELQKAVEKASKFFSLFSYSGTMMVLKRKNGKDYVVDRLSIDNDGGDPGISEDEDGEYISK